MKGTHLEINLLEGSVAPRYTVDHKELTAVKAVITEQGMESKLPLVDIQMKDAEGKEYFLMISGRLINGLSSAIKGVNLRIHGIKEP